MISVIVPYKNAAPWIGRCVLSLKKQEKDAEFILVDDHSTDDSDYIARTTAGDDKRFWLHSLPPGFTGVSTARNVGLLLSDGDWITFLDSDDEMTPNGLEIYERLIKKDKTALIHQANHLRYYAKHDKLALKYTNEAGIYSLDNLPDMWCMVWNKCYSRSLILGTQPIKFDESMRYGEDEIFNLECLAADNRIHHSKREETTVIRHFDNRESLCHIKNETDLFKQSDALADFARTHHDPTVRRAVCRLLSEHWSSKTYINTICGMEGQP